MAKSASATDMISSSAVADEPLLHGGDLAAARRLFPGAPEPFIDLSTGINPNPYPLPRFAGRFVRALAGCRRRWPRSRPSPRRAYGAPSAAMSCRRRARRFCCRWSPASCRPGRAAVLAPTYAEHARAAALAGHSVTEVARLDAVGDAATCLRRQSQQSGRPAFRPKRCCWLMAAKHLQARGGVLVVDEAFMDVGPRRRKPRARSVARQHRGAALVRQILRACRIAARLCARRAAAGGAACRACSVPGRFPGRRSRSARKALADQAWIETTRRAAGARPRRGSMPS